MQEREINSKDNNDLLTLCSAQFNIDVSLLEYAECNDIMKYARTDRVLCSETSDR